jgi:hypothetical protein
VTDRPRVLLLLLAAGCAGAPPASRPPPADLAPLPRSSIVAVLAHRSDLDLTDDQVAALEQADAELHQRQARLRAEGALQAPFSGGPWRGPLHGGGSPPEPGAAGGGQPVPGFGMNAGPGGFQVSPSMGGQGGTPPGGGAQGTGGGAPRGEPRAGTPRRDPAAAQEALDASLDDADTAAFLKAESVLAPAQRERAREIANTHREQAFERREFLRGR